MLVRWTSTVLWVTKSACAISRLVGPSAAISATRRSLGVSDSTPLRATRRGRAPVARSSRLGTRDEGRRRRRSSPARRRAGGARAPRRGDWPAEAPLPARRAPSRARAWRATLAEHVDRLLEQRHAALPPSSEARARAGPPPSARGAPQARASSSSSAASRRASSCSPSWSRASAAGERQAMNAGLTLPTPSKRRPASRSSLGAAGRIAPQDAQARAAVAKKEHALTVEARLAKSRCRERGRGVVEPALLHQRVGEKGRRVPVEAGSRAPGSAQGERLSGLGLRLEEVATPHEHEQRGRPSRRQRRGSTTPARLGERVFVDHKRLVEVRHRQDR